MLTFQHRPSYGHDRYYPIDAAARAICKIAGRTVLSQNQIDLLRLNGFSVRVEPAPQKGA